MKPVYFGRCGAIRNTDQACVCLVKSINPAVLSTGRARSCETFMAVKPRTFDALFCRAPQTVDGGSAATALTPRSKRATLTSACIHVILGQPRLPQKPRCQSLPPAALAVPLNPAAALTCLISIHIEGFGRPCINTFPQIAITQSSKAFADADPFRHSNPREHHPRRMDEFRDKSQNNFRVITTKLSGLKVEAYT